MCWKGRGKEGFWGVGVWLYEEVVMCGYEGRVGNGGKVMVGEVGVCWRDEMV